MLLPVKRSFSSVLLRPIVRFAPSPTGYLHLGSLRTALFNYLFAKQQAGQFILRIEDTDQKRLVPDSTERIIKTLDWLGISFDKGPHLSCGGKASASFIQSQRLDIYNWHAQRLLQEQKAYKCYCPKESTVKHFGKCSEKAGGSSFVIRFAFPRSRQKIRVLDSVVGEIEFNSSLFEDTVLIKADGFPTYHFASVVDDHLMCVSNVLRGQEWQTSLPIHNSLYEAFGWKAPEFTHLPLIVNPDGSKLSKRNNSLMVETLQSQGFLAEAVVNFSALLGWNPGAGCEKEIFTMEELVSTFKLQHINKASSVCDLKRLFWMNKQHYSLHHTETSIREEYQKAMQEALTARKDASRLDDSAYFTQIIDISKGRTSTKELFVELSKYFFVQPEYNSQKFCKEHEAIATHFFQAFTKVSQWKAEELKSALNSANHLASFGSVAKTLRYITTAQSIGPPLTQILQVLGKEVVLSRLQAYLICVRPKSESQIKIG